MKFGSELVSFSYPQITQINFLNLCNLWMKNLKLGRHSKFGVLAVAMAIVSHCSAGEVNIASGVRLAPIGNLRVARLSHTATLLPSGKVLIAGGSNGGQFLASAEIFDPADNTFTQISDMTSRRAGHTATLLRNGTVLIAGGAERPDRNLASAEVFDPATGKFTATGSLATARTDHSATLLQDGRVLVVGGSEVWPQSLASAELYDPQTGRFTPTGSLNEARRPAGVALLKNGDVLFSGGTGVNKTVLASAELYDAAKGVFTRVGSMASRRHKHTASTLADGSVLITGGSDERDWKNVYRSAEVFDPVKKEFQPASDMNSAHFKHRAVVLPDGRIVVAGGSKSVEIYDPGTKRFEVANGEFEKPYYFPSATLLNDGRVLISGGYDEDNNTTSTAWILNTAK